MLAAANSSLAVSEPAVFQYGITWKSRLMCYLSVRSYLALRSLLDCSTGASPATSPNLSLLQKGSCDGNALHTSRRLSLTNQFAAPAPHYICMT